MGGREASDSRKENAVPLHCHIVRRPEPTSIVLRNGPNGDVDGYVDDGGVTGRAAEGGNDRGGGGDGGGGGGADGDGRMGGGGLEGVQHDGDADRWVWVPPDRPDTDHDWVLGLAKDVQSGANGKRVAPRRAGQVGRSGGGGSPMRSPPGSPLGPLYIYYNG